MKIYITDFMEGMLGKLAETSPSVFNMKNTSLFPTIDQQASWKFRRHDGHLHLSDGNVVHNFHIPNGEKEDEDFPLHKKEDSSIFDFNKEQHGTAQVHKANPGYFYVTLHDGHKNPTYTLKHVNDNEWRAIPKQKKHEEAIEINKAAFEQVVIDKLAEELPFGQSIMDKGLKGLHHGVAGLGRGISYLADSPLRAAGIGLGAGALYDLGKRTLYNSPEENQEETGKQRLLRYLAPTALLGGVGLGVDSLISEKSRHDPFRAYTKGPAPTDYGYKTTNS